MPFSETTNFPAASPLPVTSEKARLREHFLGAIEMLMSRDVSAVPAARRAKRRAVLDALVLYALSGRFPRNTDFPGRMAPFFVDRAGTRCAVAYLVERAGGDVLVDKLARRLNHAYVEELAKDAEFARWLDEHGLSVEEAARIQPGYCESVYEYCIEEGNWSTLVEAAVIGQGTGSDLQVVAVYGSAASVSVGQTLSASAYGFTVGDHVLATNLVDDLWQVEYGILPDGATVDTSTCGGGVCAIPIPPTAPKSAFVSLAMGTDFDAAFGADPGWLASDCCGQQPDQASSAANSVASSSAAAGAGGESGTGGSAASPSGRGCDCAFTTPSPSVAPLLAALVALVAVSRRRRRLLRSARAS